MRPADATPLAAAEPGIQEGFWRVRLPDPNEKAPSGLAEARFLRVPRSASPGLLESNPWRRLTMSEHRGHLLPDTEDISCRAAATVGLHAERRQRIYLWPRSSGARRSGHVAVRRTRGEA